MARDCARQWNVPYIETSAKTRHNVQKVFFDILLMIDKKKENDRKLALESGPNTSNTLCTRCILLWFYDYQWKWDCSKDKKLWFIHFVEPLNYNFLWIYENYTKHPRFISIRKRANYSSMCCNKNVILHHGWRSWNKHQVNCYIIIIYNRRQC